MTDLLLTNPVALAAAMALAGAGFGVIYLEALRRTVDAIAGGAGWRRPVALTVARLVVVAVLLVLAARLGAVPLLAAFGGFLVARTVVLRRARRTP